jgi:hypothetical protein
MARSRRAAEANEEPEVEPQPKPEPVATVKRELISPTGQKVLVDVPVYPPFRLETHVQQKPSERRRGKAGRPVGRTRHAPSTAGAPEDDDSEA